MSLTIQSDFAPSMSSNRRHQVFESLRDNDYRSAFTDEHVGTGLAFQIRLLREDNGWTQEELAQRASKAQETISQWENPDYGRYSLNTLKELAKAFDVGLLVRFVAFSELVDWTVDVTPKRLRPLSYRAEYEQEAVLVPVTCSISFEGLPDDDGSMSYELTAIGRTFSEQRD